MGKTGNGIRSALSFGLVSMSLRLALPVYFWMVLLSFLFVRPRLSSFKISQDLVGRRLARIQVPYSD